MVEFSDRAWIEPLLRAGAQRGAEYCFGNVFMWSYSSRFRVAQVEGMFTGRYDRGTHSGYLFPSGSGDLKSCIEALMEDAGEWGLPLILYYASEEAISQLNELFPGRFTVCEDVNSADYIYETTELLELSGKRFHGKRNHISRFLERDWAFEPITPQNLPACMEMNKRWCKENDCAESKELSRELCAVSRALDNFFTLGLTGALLRVDGEVIAYTAGEPLTSDTFVIHIEKAFYDVQGAYPMINREFVRTLAPLYRYVNREDDAGVPGLRKAKQSYYPAFMQRKFTATYER